jgi:hypothetical protein
MQYATEMDLVKSKYHEESNCLEFDSVSSDHNMLITYILKKFGHVTRYVPVWGGSRRPSLRQHLEDLLGDFFFVYNPNHIWGAKLIQGVWHNVDSISGVRATSLANLESTGTGFIIPVSAPNEFYRNVSTIRDILARNFCEPNIESISSHISHISSKGLILGDLEVPLGLAIDILETNMQSKNSKNFKPIQRLIDRYRGFLSKFTPDNYHNDSLKLKYVPGIILTLINV